MRTLTCLVVLGLAAPLTAADKPNIVLIMADDFGYECVAANGGSYRTPNLDRLAAGGTRFTHAYSTPLCTPSRVQIMTGRYNFRNYVRFGAFDFREKTFAHVLKDAGYTTGIFGKWQLGGGFEGPHRAGFDEYCLWQFDPATRGSRYHNPKLFKNGQEMGNLKGRYGPDVFFEQASDFVTRHKDKPFLLYWPAVLTHGPFEPTPDSRPGKTKRDTDNFPDMVAYLDKLVGKLVAHLEKEGLREKTLILFTGDNGTGKPIRSRLDGKEVQGGKGTTTTLGTHAPLIANRPGTVPAGRVCDDLIDFTDLLPTLADVAGAKPPAGVTLDGRSFLPQLKGETGTPREWIFCHYEPRHGKKDRKERYAQDRQWKLYQDGRLYDLRADLDEQRPLKPDSGGETARQVREKLQAVLDRMEKEKSFNTK